MGPPDVWETATAATFAGEGEEDEGEEGEGEEDGGEEDEGEEDEGEECAGGEQLSPPAVEIFEENSHPGCGIPPLPKERTRNTGGRLNLMLNEEPVSTRKDAPLISSLT